MSDDTGKPSLFDELKRRNVIRVAALYAVVAWVLVQIGEPSIPEGPPGIENDGRRRATGECYRVISS